jgi:uncharacterized protein with GYD domain
MKTRRAVLVAVLVVLSVVASGLALPAERSPSDASLAESPGSGLSAADPSVEEAAPPMPRPVPTAGVQSDDSNATTEHTTTDESPTPETTTAAEADDDLPPGLNESGVENASALVAAHEDSLADTGFSFEFQANVSAGPASQWTLQRGTVEENTSPLSVRSTSVRDLDGQTTTFATDLWADDDSVAVRHSRGNQTELRQYNRSGGNVGVYDESWAHLPRADLESQVTLSWLLDLALTVGEYDLDRVEERDGDRVAVLRATDPVAAANYTHLNATLLVGSDGQVRSLSLTATGEDDAATRIHHEFRLTEVGEVDVERPDWVKEAEPPEGTNETTETETTTRDG